MAPTVYEMFFLRRLSQFRSGPFWARGREGPFDEQQDYQVGGRRRQTARGTSNLQESLHRMCPFHVGRLPVRVRSVLRRVEIALRRSVFLWNPAIRPVGFFVALRALPLR